jgi:hypothetical protein
MIVEVFKPYHIDLLRAQGVQGAQLAEVSIVPVSCVIQPPGPAVTAFDEHHHIILCGGIVVQAPGRGECWALMADGVGKHMRALHYATRRFLAIQPWRRLEATIEEGFGAGCRWVELLGFEYEGTMKNYGLNGETHLRYAKVG